MEIPIPQWLIDVVIWFGHLFAPDEWKALALSVVVTLSGTQAAKIVWRALPWTRGGHSALVNLFALLIGFGATLAFLPKGANWWVPVLVGLIPGPLAIGIFKASFPILQWLVPGLAKFVNADRRKDPNPIPPAGMPDQRRE